MTVAPDCEQPCAKRPECVEAVKDHREDQTVTVTDTEELDDEELEATEASLYFEGFHDFYMRKDQVEYIVPVIFEDGMDFEECEQYYASLKSQEPTLRSSLRTRLQRKSSLRELQQIIASDSPSCLRRMPRYKSNIDLEKAKVRRCSFGGTAPVAQERPTLERSNSDRDVQESSPGVSFHRHVQVWTVYAAYEYPQDIRQQMWMSREEMRHCMQRAVAEKVAERRRQLMRQQEQAKKRAEEEQKLLAAQVDSCLQQTSDNSIAEVNQAAAVPPEEPAQEFTVQRQDPVSFVVDDKKDAVQRQNSDNCVMAEYLHTVEQMAEYDEHASERLEI